MHTVIETNAYLAQAKHVKCSDEERAAIVDYLANNPDAGVLIPGTGGARKLRIAAKGKGKSGGFRVITYYAAEDVPVFLLDILSKGERATLTRAECNAVKKYLSTLADDYRKNIRKAS